MDNSNLVRSLIPELFSKGVPFATALRRTFAQGYNLTSLRHDLLAGVVVGIVALPLSMALAIAVGVAPQHGLYTAIVAGSIVALAGGSKHQVTGPTAAFVVILAPIVTRYGLSGLLTAGLMAGVLLVVMGLARFGKLIQFIPHPVTTGFTAGIALVIASLQLKDVFALQLTSTPDAYLERMHAFWLARRSASLPDFGVAVATLSLLLLLPRKWPRLASRLPAPLLVLALISVCAELLTHWRPEFRVVTIASRFQTTVDGQVVRGIPGVLPRFEVPWGEAGLSLATFRELASAAFAIAMLGAIESLLSAVIADGMTGKKHDPDAELVALGVGNICASFFGGIAATGALARTATNVRAGARSPVAAATHSLVVLLAVLLLAPLLGHVPMAALAALLLLVAWNMSEIGHALTVIRIAPRSDVFVLLICFFLTVIFDMVVAVGVGVVLASFLFMRRTAELTRSRIFQSDDTDAGRALPAGVTLYEIAGPLFFGAAQNAMGALGAINAQGVIVLSLAQVPSIDATGLVALESALVRAGKSKQRVVLAGPLPEPRAVFERAELPRRHAHVVVCSTLEEAIALAGELAAGPSSASAPRSAKGAET
ncbi:MAG TPA: C4-dicarboxylic acid transporter DauA [Polyangiaceae bacterium]|nr:C4-dicarboxylic acid transporter DauA [Polyangiaceae bacterium]